MGIRFTCPNGHSIHVKAYLAGKRGVCPKCGARVEIPNQSSVPSATSPPATPKNSTASEDNASQSIVISVASDSESGSKATESPSSMASASLSPDPMVASSSGSDGGAPPKSTSTVDVAASLATTDTFDPTSPAVRYVVQRERKRRNQFTFAVVLLVAVFVLALVLILVLGCSPAGTPSTSNHSKFVEIQAPLNNNTHSQSKQDRTS